MIECLVNGLTDNFDNIELHFLMPICITIISSLVLLLCTACKKENEYANGDIIGTGIRVSNGGNANNDPQTRELPEPPLVNVNKQLNGISNTQNDLVDSCTYTEVGENTYAQPMPDSNIYECVPGDTPNQSGSGVIEISSNRNRTRQNVDVNVVCERPLNNINDTDEVSSNSNPNTIVPIVPDKCAESSVIVNVIQSVPPSRTGNIYYTGKDPPYSDISARESLLSLRERAQQQNNQRLSDNVLYESVEDAINYDSIPDMNLPINNRTYAEINENLSSNYDQIPNSSQLNQSTTNSNEANREDSANKSLSPTGPSNHNHVYSKIHKKDKKFKSIDDDLPVYSIVKKPLKKSSQPNTNLNGNETIICKMEDDYDTVSFATPNKQPREPANSIKNYATYVKKKSDDESAIVQDKDNIVWQRQDHIYQEINDKNSAIKNTKV